MVFKQIYPRDVYRVLLMISGETDVSFPKLVNIVLREGLIRLEKLPEETSQAHLLKPKPLGGKVERDTKKPVQEDPETRKRFIKQALEGWDEYPDEQKIHLVANILGKKRELLPEEQELLKRVTPEQTEKARGLVRPPS